MSGQSSATRPGPADDGNIAGRLPAMDRFLPAWIAAAMAAGLILGRLIPDLGSALGSVAIHGTSLPIAIGLLAMMYPVLAKVRYAELGRITADRRMITASLALNWVIGPAVMFALAWLLLPDQPAYRTGVILVGLARCIAMVLIWTDLARGDREMAAVLVALNAVFQVLAYAALGVFYLNVLPGWLGLPAQNLQVSFAVIAVTVVVFLGIPLVTGYLTRTLGERARGREWYESRLLPRIGPIALYGLLFTVVVLFALQGKTITSQPLNVVRIAAPLLAYFAVMWSGGFAIARRLRLSYERTAALAFSAASNDFELAIAVAIGVFGATSGQALAGVVGPLIEVPVLLGLVYVALWLHRRLAWPQPAGSPDAHAAARPGVSQADATTARPGVLFVCVHDAGRSQMAAALLDHYAAGRVTVRSADPAPADSMTPPSPRSWPNSGSTWPGSSPSHRPPKWCRPATWSSPWAAATPAPSTPASATSTGNSTTRPGKTPPPSGASAKTSMPASAPCSPTCSPAPRKRSRPTRTGAGNQPCRGGHLPPASGADPGGADESGAPGAAGRMAAQLPAGRTGRFPRRAGGGTAALASRGGIPTLQTLAAVHPLGQHLPGTEGAVVNVGDLMRLQSPAGPPHGMSGTEYDVLFTTRRPVIFARHGYLWLIRWLTYRRHGHDHLHVRGYKEEGTTTPFDTVKLNDLDGSTWLST